MDLYSSTLVMKLFNNSIYIKLFEAEIITVKLKASLLLNASLHIRSLTFITKALCLVATVECYFCSFYCATLVYLADVHNVLC